MHRSNKKDLHRRKPVADWSRCHPAAQPKPTENMIALINTFDRLPNSIGTVVSLHRSADAAEKANRRLQQSIKRGHGRNSYLPMQISAVCKGRWRKGDSVRESELV